MSASGDAVLPLQNTLEPRAFVHARRTYFDMLPHELLWHIARMTPDRSEYRAAVTSWNLNRSMTTVSGAPPMRQKERAIRVLCAGLPAWGRVSGMLVVAAASDRVLAADVLQLYFSGSTCMGIPLADAIQVRAESESGAMSLRMGIIASFLENRAVGWFFCRDCGVDTTGVCPFRASSICSACETIATRDALTMSEAFSLFTGETISSNFDAAYRNGAWIFRLRDSVNVSRLRKKIRSPGPWPDSADAYVATPSPSSVEHMFPDDCDNPQSAERRLHARISWVNFAVKSGDDGLCKDVAQSVYGRKRSSPSAAGRCTSGSPWVDTLEGLTKSKCIYCRERTESVCMWFMRLAMCQRCHVRWCGEPLRGEVSKYGVLRVLVARRPGTLHDILDGKRREVLPPRRQSTHCRRQVAKFAADGYQVPKETVCQRVAEFRAGLTPCPPFLAEPLESLPVSGGVWPAWR